MTQTEAKRDSVMAKVRKILDLAEGSDKQGEIDAALAQAQKLMAMHAIEMSELDKLKDDGKPEQIIERQIDVGPAKSPISSAKGNLSVSVAENNRCRVFKTIMWGAEGKRYFLTIVGYESDVDFVEMLWTSLCVQMDAAHNRAKVNKREWVNGRTFRSNFNDGFNSEASRRLRKMRVENERQIEQESTGSSLVLIDRDKAVEAEMSKYNLRRSYSGRSSYDGHARQAGQDAASRADYSGGRTGRIGNRDQIEA